MPPTRRIAPLAAAILGASLALAGPANAKTLAAHRDSSRAVASSVPDIRQLYRAATAAVRGADHGQLANAVLYEADGTAAGGRAARTAQQITRWHFVFDNPTANSPYASATIDYGPAPRSFGHVVGYRDPYLEDQQIPRAPRLSLAAALQRLRTAGYPQPFTSVTLRNPVGPPFAGTQYFFALSGGSGRTSEVSVGVSNGRIIRPGP